MGFNTQPPEGGWDGSQRFAVDDVVSTHSRPKAAGTSLVAAYRSLQFQHTAARRRLVSITDGSLNVPFVSTHSRPKAAGKTACLLIPVCRCFNTQPPEGGWGSGAGWARNRTCVSTHSRPKAAGLSVQTQKPAFAFQHTAARRRLVNNHCCSY